MSRTEIPFEAIIRFAIAKEQIVSNMNLFFSLVAMKPRRRQPAPSNPAMFGFIKIRNARERQNEIWADLRRGFFIYKMLVKKNSVATIAVLSLYHQKHSANTVTVSIAN